MNVVTKAALRRLRSKSATRYDGQTARTITVLHRHAVTGAQLSTTGRLIAETPYELALLVHGTPEVIVHKRIIRRSDVPVTASA